MGNIPLAEYGSVQRTQITSRRDASAEMAPGRALEQVGRAVQVTANELEGWADRRQKLADQAGLARIQLQVRATQGQVEKSIAPQVDPESGEVIAPAPDWTTWEQGASKIWETQKYDDVMASMSDEARLAAQSMIADASQKSVIDVSVKASQRAVQEDNAAIFANAQDLARNGKWEEAMAALDGYHGNPEQIERMKQAIYEEGAFAEVARELEEIEMVSDDPVSELYEFQNQINAKDDNGNYTMYKRLTDGGRDTLKRNVQANIKKLERYNLLKTDRLMKDAMNGDLTDGQIEMSQLPEETKENLRIMNSQTAEAEMAFDEDAKVVQQKLEKFAASTLTIPLVGTFEAKPNSEAFQKLLNEIANANLTSETKFRYFSQAMDLRARELSHGEERVTDNPWYHLFLNDTSVNRSVTPQEIGMRNRLMQMYRTEAAKSEDGAVRMAGLMLNQEDAIRQYFETPEDARTMDPKEFFGLLKKQIAYESAGPANQQYADSLLD